jgi:hypothetical protein
MAAWLAKNLSQCRYRNVKPLFSHEAWATQARGVILMRINFLILTVGWLAFGLGVIVTVMAFFYNLIANGAGYRGVFLILMGTTILAVQQRRTRGAKNTIRRSSR